MSIPPNINRDIISYVDPEDTYDGKVETRSQYQRAKEKPTRTGVSKIHLQKLKLGHTCTGRHTSCVKNSCGTKGPYGACALSFPLNKSYLKRKGWNKRTRGNKDDDFPIVEPEYVLHMQQTPDNPTGCHEISRSSVVYSSLRNVLPDDDSTTTT